MLQNPDPRTLHSAHIPPSPMLWYLGTNLSPPNPGPHLPPELETKVHEDFTITEKFGARHKDKVALIIYANLPAYPL